MSVELVFESQSRFSIWRDDTKTTPLFTFRDSLSPSNTQKKYLIDFCLEQQLSRRVAFRLLMPACLDLFPLSIEDKPVTPEDSCFWQYPAITEKLALEKHREILRVNVTTEHTGSINAYLGLPWATFIDKKSMPGVARQMVRTRLLGYRLLAEEWKLKWGKDLLVHTVCQHTQWEKMLVFWRTLGITDVHLSHCEENSLGVASNYGVRVHSWPLVAANVVNTDRAEGLTFGKRLREKRYLASFIGSYLSNHRSNVRLRLHNEARRDGGADIYVQVNREWHFNAVVYQEQLEGRPLDNFRQSAEQFSTRHYNRLLSDSTFSLCPEGAGPNTLRLWESLAVGSIPVIIVEDWIFPPIPGEDLLWQNCAIHVLRNEIVGLFDRLRQLKANQLEKLEDMQLNGMKLYTKFCHMRCF